jgi:hypothetical protein
MSHVASIDLEVKDLACLKEACKELGLTFNEGESKYQWYGQFVDDYNGEDAAYKHGFDPERYGKDAEHTISCSKKDAYEVGVIMKDGQMQLIYDFWNNGNGLEDHVGKRCCKLKQGYAKHVALKKAKRLGFAVKEAKNDDGTVRLTLTR